MPIRIGDLVRDKANLGGRVISRHRESARVIWNNGREGWISIDHLTKEVDGDEELRRIHKKLGPRWRYNDPRFSEDLPDYFYWTY